MIELIFYYGTEIVYVKVDGHNVTFASGSNGAYEAPLSGLRLSKVGVIKEHPDLEGREDWREVALERWNAKIKELDKEEAISNYIIADLKIHGYIPKFKQRRGFRRIAINGN